MGKKASKKKPLHLQKQKANDSKDSFGPKLSTDAWYVSEDGGNEVDQHSSWLAIKNQLIKFYDEKDCLELKSLVKFWGDSEVLNSLCAATLPFVYAERLYAMAKMAIKTEDLHAASLMILAAGLMNQLKVTSFCDVSSFVDNNKSSDEAYDDNLAEILAFCYNAVNGTKSPARMVDYLEELNVDILKANIAAAEPLITIRLKDGGDPERKLEGINSLITLTELLTHGGVSSNIRMLGLKHNDSRLFLSKCGKRSLSDLGIVNGDVIEIEDFSNSTSFDAPFGDITTLSINGGANGGKRSKRKGKGKKNGKGKGKR